MFVHGNFFVCFVQFNWSIFKALIYVIRYNYLYMLFQSSSILLSVVLISVYCLSYVSFASLLQIFFLRQIYWNPTVVKFYWILKVKDLEDSPSSRETFLRWQHLAFKKLGKKVMKEKIAQRYMNMMGTERECRKYAKLFPWECRILPVACIFALLFAQPTWKQFLIL